MAFHDPPATAALAPSAPAAPPPARPVRFVGDSKTFWRLLIRGAALLAVTLGTYRFWLVTDVRRFLWSNTEIAGESLEYNGTATELLIGFLIAVALLLPINLGFFVLALGMGTVGEFASVLGFPVLFVLGQFAFYRARRYRLTRTVYRGVRFHQTGSAWRYAFCATFWWVLIVLTLGLAYPFAQASLERYKMRNTYYGDLGGRFEGSSFRLFMRGILMWFLVIAPFALCILMIAVSVDWGAFGDVMSSGGGPGTILEVEGVQGSVVFAVIGVSATVFMAAVLFPAFQAMTLRWWVGGLRFGELTVGTQLLTRRIYGAYWRFLWYALLFSLLAAVVGFIGFAAFGAMPETLTWLRLSELAGVGAAVGFYVVLMLGYSAIYQGTVRLTLWRHAVESTDLRGLAVLDQVKAVGRPSSAIGEGLADALNVGGI